jgi:hypothetical protein
MVERGDREGRGSLYLDASLQESVLLLLLAFPRLPFGFDVFTLHTHQRIYLHILNEREDNSKVKKERKKRHEVPNAEEEEEEEEG